MASLHPESIKNTELIHSISFRQEGGCQSLELWIHRLGDSWKQHSSFVLSFSFQLLSGFLLRTSLPQSAIGNLSFWEFPVVIVILFLLGCFLFNWCSWLWASLTVSSSSISSFSLLLILCALKEPPPPTLLQNTCPYNSFLEPKQYTLLRLVLFHVDLHVKYRFEVKGVRICK